MWGLVVDTHSINYYGFPKWTFNIHLTGRLRMICGRKRTRGQTRCIETDRETDRQRGAFWGTHKHAHIKRVHNSYIYIRIQLMTTWTWRTNNIVFTYTYAHTHTIYGIQRRRRRRRWRPGRSSDLLTGVVLAEQLHAHDGKDEDNDTQYERQVAQGAHGATHDRDQQVQRWPRLCKLKHAKLRAIV